jgi:hypothetical protein
MCFLNTTLDFSIIVNEQFARTIITDNFISRYELSGKNDQVCIFAGVGFVGYNSV